MILFIRKQLSACIFGLILLALMLVSKMYWPEGSMVARYDALVVAALLVQILLIWSGLETWEEAKVILVFHIAGTVMELFKTANGSWEYPEDSLIRIMGVPLFSGFMYASVGSYIARCWRIFDLKFTGFPPFWLAFALASAIYINFFAHHYTVDIRLFLFIAAVLIFGLTMVSFQLSDAHKRYRFPLVAGFLAIGFLIWIAENIATYSRIWIYPNQSDTWEIVSLHKVGAWFLLMIISFMLTAALHRKELQKT